MSPLDQYKEKIDQFCQKHHVQSLYVFGSILSDSFNDKSDVDLLIQFNPVDVETYFDNYMDLKEQLEKLFQRPVDLLENQAIRNPIFRQIVDREKQLIYEREAA